MTPLRNFAFCLLTAALGCSSASDPAPSAPAPTDGPTPAPSDEPPPAHVAACPAGHPFRLVSGKIVVDVTLDDDGKTQSWVLDTGAFSSIADTSLAGRVPRQWDRWRSAATRSRTSSLRRSTTTS